MRHAVLGYKALHSEAFVPAYATLGSACFDIRVCLPSGHRTVDVWTAANVHSRAMAFPDPLTGSPDAVLRLEPGDRALLPTQLILDIPEGYSVRMHMRSGLAIKGGLMLSNCEGIIDSDYTQQLMVPVTNTTRSAIRINHGDRICQGEIVENIHAEFVPVGEIPTKGDRTGGFGSTGKA
jgi:dUTP pyrophosphatase